MCVLFICGDKMKKFMLEAIKEAEKALSINEVPVGAIIVKNNKIISKGYNQKEKTHNVTRHAEIIAIERACKKLKTWRLYDCEIYITLEPCLMCCGAIEQARISKIYYAIGSPFFGQIENNNKVYANNKKIKIYSKICEFESQNLLQKFFEEKRK